MWQTREAYQYDIQKIKKDEESIVCERFATAMFDNNDWNLWSAVKRISGNKAGIIIYVDGLTESDSIAKLFAVKAAVSRLKLHKKEKAVLNYLLIVLCPGYDVKLHPHRKILFSNVSWH